MKRGLDTGREDTNIERCNMNLSRGRKKTNGFKTVRGRQSKYNDRKGRKTPAFHHLEHTCLFFLM